MTDDAPEEERRPHDLVRVATVRDQVTASLRRMALEEAGIEALVSGDDTAGAYPSLGLERGFHIRVRDADAEAARELLKALDEGAAELPLEPEDR